MTPGAPAGDSLSAIQGTGECGNWHDPDGTHVGYLDPRELADRYALDGHQQTLERQTAVLTKLAAAAAS